MNTVKEIREGIVRSLTPHVGKDDAEAMARIILEDAAGVSRTAAIIDPGRLLEDATVARISAIVGRVADGEPLQYVLGEAVFMMGMENNSDIVRMASYAPIFANVNETRWRPDMIQYDATRVLGTPSYYVQKMMITQNII